MQKWIDNNDILMYSTNNESKSVIAEKFIKKSSTRIYKKMTANDSKSYLTWINLNKFIHEYNNIYHQSINKKDVIADYSGLNEITETASTASNFKFNNRVRITRCKSVFSKVYTENWSRKIFITNSVLKVNPWTHRLEDLKEEEIIQVFMKKNCWSISSISYYPEQDSHSRNKVKVVLDLSNYTNKEELEHAVSINTSGIAVKKILLLWKLKLIN